MSTPNDEDEERETMTPQEVMRELGISRTTLQRLISERVLLPTAPINPLFKRQPPFTFWRDDVLRVKAADKPRPRKPYQRHDPPRQQ